MHVWSLLTAALLVAWLALASPDRVWAEAPGSDTQANQTCVVCHATPGLGMQTASGDSLPVTVNPTVFSQSVHGAVLQCRACHPEVTGYPHAGREVARPAIRDIPYLERAVANCGSCHRAEYDEYVGSAHAQALSSGKTGSAVCSDCHGAHDTQLAQPAEVGLALGPAVYACAPCHQEQFDQYKNSAHGKAALNQGDVNVATCVDCHGAHDLHQAKDDPDWRVQSVAMCSTCHANATLMRQYGLSSEILATYVADFHGTTAQLYPATSSQAPEQAMCYDCHGSHAIASTAGSDGLAVQANLVKACRSCHADAASDFPAAWLGHDSPSPDHSALVFWIRVIYNVLIAGVVLLLVGHIMLDLGRVFVNTLHKGTHAHD